MAFNTITQQREQPDRRKLIDRRSYTNQCLGVPYPHDRRQSLGRRSRDQLTAMFAYYGA